jgi:hypothetical protein
MDPRSIFLDAARDARFARDGLVVIDLLSQEEIARLQKIFDRFSDYHPAGFSATILSGDLDYRRAVNAEVSGVLGAKITGTLRNYRLVCAGFAVKKPPGGAMPLHRDISMVRPEERPGISFWAPLVDVEPGSGCLEVLPGSHRTGGGHPRAAGMAGTGAEDSAGRLVNLPMRAGQALFLDGGTLHASGDYQCGEARPVAVAPLTPREAPIMYYHCGAGNQELEEFEVDDSFYLTHRLGTRPAAGHFVGL